MRQESPSNQPACPIQNLYTLNSLVSLVLSPENHIHSLAGLREGVGSPSLWI